MGDVEGSKPHAFTHDYPPRISSMGILYPIYAENLFETFVHPLVDRFTHGLRTLHLDITGLCGRGWWEKLQPTLSSLGPTLQELTLRLAVKLGASEKKWLKTQVLSHIDLCVLPNLTTFHLSTLWHEDASLHLLQSLACPHLRMITLDATFDSLDLSKPEDFGKHDDVLVRFSQDHPVQVVVKYFGGLTTQKFQSHIASAFPKVNERGLLRIVKVSSELDLEMGPFFEEFLPMELDFCL